MKNETHSRKISIRVLAAAAIVTLLILAVQGVRHVATDTVSTAEGLAYIENAEAQELYDIDDRIQLLDEAEETYTNRSVKEKFSGSVVLGDSQAAALLTYDVLYASNVLALDGAAPGNCAKLLEQAAQVSPKNIILAFGTDVLLGKTAAESDDASANGTDAENTDTENADSDDADSDSTDSDDADPDSTDSDDADSDSTNSSDTDADGTDSGDTDSDSADTDDTDSDSTDAADTASDSASGETSASQTAAASGTDSAGDTVDGDDADEAAQAEALEEFISDYKTLISEIRQEFPETHIFICSVLYAADGAAEQYPALSLVETYNTELIEMCDTLQIGYIDSDTLSVWSEHTADGIYFPAEWYARWAKNMAESASL